MCLVRTLPPIDVFGLACDCVVLVGEAGMLRRPLPPTFSAWLLAQLNLDLPMYADNIAAEHRDAVAQWATVPPVLAAAEHVELLQLSEESVMEAINAWRLPGGDADRDCDNSDGDNSERAATLLQWWNTYQQGSTPWAVAQAALEAMLFAPALASDADSS